MSTFHYPAHPEPCPKPTPQVPEVHLGAPADTPEDTARLFDKGARLHFMEGPLAIFIAIFTATVLGLAALLLWTGFDR